MTTENTQKHLKTYDEAFLELKSFIRKSREEARQAETDVQQEVTLTQNDNTPV